MEKSTMAQPSRTVKPIYESLWKYIISSFEKNEVTTWQTLSYVQELYAVFRNYALISKITYIFYL